MYRLKKEHLSQKAYERWVDFLDLIGLSVGQKHHGENAARKIVLNIGDGFFEQEKRFMSTKRDQTGRVPFLGQTGDEVTVHGRTFDLEQYQVLDDGRPKQLHLKAVEMKDISVTGEALFKASDINLKDLTVLNADKDHVKKVTVGGCFDGGSSYQGAETGVKGLRVTANDKYRGKHDRMHKENLAFKEFMSRPQFYGYAQVVELCRTIISYLGNSTKKLRKLKEIEVELDVLKEVDDAMKLYNDELRRMANECPEAKQYVDEFQKLKLSQLEFLEEEKKIERSVFNDSDLQTIKAQAAQLGLALDGLHEKRQKLEQAAKENAERRTRAHKLTRIFEIRMVNGVHKSLLMLKRRYIALLCFFSNEVEAKEEGALLIWRKMTSFPRVCRFLSLLDITEVLTKSLCLEQIGSVTVLHLDTLNNRLFESLDELIDTDMRRKKKVYVRFGVNLAEHAEDLSKTPPKFQGFDLHIRGKPIKAKDKLVGIRKLQKRGVVFLKSAMKSRLALTKYEQACQCLLPTKQSDENQFDQTLDSNLDIIIRANINFIGDDSIKQKLEIGLKKLIKFFKNAEFSKFTALEVLDAYQVIWKQRRYWNEVGPDTMALIECVLVDPHSSANCERAGKVLELIITAYRKQLYERTVDAEMRIALNGPHERLMRWSYYSNRWYRVLSLNSPICKDDRASGISQVVQRHKKKAMSKDTLDLKCSFYTYIPPRQSASDQ